MIELIMDKGTINLENQLYRLETLDKFQPLRVEGVDFTVNHPGMLREELGDTFNYFGRVEMEVERNVLELIALLPNADELTRRFYYIWQAQEIPHGLIFEELQRQLGLQPAELDLHVSPGIKLAGYLSHVPGIHEVLLYNYLVTGAMHEKLTAEGYKLLDGRLVQLGEKALSQTLVRPILGQEHGHYAYYWNAAMLVKRELSDWQLHLSRLMRQYTYRPVGAGNATQLADFGDVARQLINAQRPADERDALNQFSLPVEKVARELLYRREEQGLKMSRFVMNKFVEVVDSAHEREGLISVA